MSEDLVISGIAGRYPGCDSIDQLNDNLFAKKDLITIDENRWPPGLYDQPLRHGKISDINRFDAQFFGIHGKQVNAMDPQLRILLEMTYEAVLDSGTSIKSLTGSQTGVFIGSSISHMSTAHSSRAPDISAYSLPGCDLSMFANRISYTFDLKGPSYTLNTACSSSAVALNQAVVNIRSGQCDAAIVGGVNIILDPGHSVSFSKLQMLSTDGKCKFLDESADGYVRSEACSVVFLQKSSQAKRIYATIVGILSNTDGYKEQGITYPSHEVQSILMKSTLEAANIDPNSVLYIEAHGTGTQAGDQCEMKAIARTYCEDRDIDRPLLVGSVKTNLGHSEAASALTSIAKVLISFENNSIPASIHFNKPNPNISALTSGLIKPVTENIEFDDNSVVGINSFGFGGANVHILLRPNTRATTEEEYNIIDKIPRISLVSGRTEEAVNYFIESIVKKVFKINRGMLKLMNNVKDTPGMGYRGYFIAHNNNKEHDNKIVIQTGQAVHKFQNIRPLWFIFPGMGSQWPAIAKGLKHLPIFNESILKSSEVIKEFGLDLMAILYEESNAIDDIVNAFIAITATQIALIDLFRELDIIADGFIGHSFGELACAYCDGGIDRKQILMNTYWRARLPQQSNLTEGLMAAVGLSWEECHQRCPEGVFPACHNSDNSVTISGDFLATKNFLNQLREENIFAKEVNSCGIAFHSPYIQHILEPLLLNTKKFITEPKLRSPKWISSSVPESDWDTDLAKYCSAEYFINNMSSPVLFKEALQHVPKNAVVIEISPHSLLQPIIKQSLGTDITYIPLMKKNNSENLQLILSAIGRLYQLGFNPETDKLYPRVSYPVSRGTPSLSPLIKWDHSDDWFVPLYPEYFNPSNSSEYKVTIDLDRIEDAYYSDHCLEGQKIFPGSGYLILVWQMLAKSIGKPIDECPIEFDNVNFVRATHLSQPGQTVLSIRSGFDGEFFIQNNNNMVCTGRAVLFGRLPDESGQSERIKQDCLKNSDPIRLNCIEVYKEFRIRGYDYGHHFRLIRESSADGLVSKVAFNGNWVAFLDNVSQVMIMSRKHRVLGLPVKLRVRVDPRFFTEKLEDLDKEPVFDVFHDKKLNVISIGKGLELKDMIMTSVIRKSRPCNIESYKFVLYHDVVASDHLDMFIKMNTSVTKKIICQLILNGHQVSNIFSNLGENIWTDSTNLVIPNKHKLTKILNDTCSHPDQLRDVLTTTLQVRDIDLMSIDQIYSDDAIIRPLLDIAIENSSPYAFSVLELAHCQDDSFIKSIQTICDRTALLDVYYTLALPKGTIISSEILTGISTTNWNPELEIIPQDYSADLIVYKESLTLQDDNSKIFNMLECLYACCKMNGFVMLIVRTGITHCERIVHWLLNKKYKTIDESFLMSKVIDIGFVVIGKRSYSNLFNILLLRKVVNTTYSDQTIVNITTNSLEHWIDTLKIELKECQTRPEGHNLWIMANDSAHSGVIGLVNCLRREPGCERIRCLFIGDDENHSLDATVYEDIFAKDLVMNVIIDDQLGSFRHLALSEEVYNTVKSCSHAYINVSTKGDLSSLKWFESEHKYWPIGQKNGQTLIQVYYSALNFRDIMISTGKLSPESLPGDLAFEKSILGHEFTGRDQSGQRVIGMVGAKALATTVVVNASDFLWPIPDHWSMSDASTVPVAYCTAYYALIMRGKMRRGETVLIHSGSGAVGQAAITIALNSGCQVFTTVGNQEKRDYLAQIFPQLNANCFANSRDTSFEFDILRETKGRGVDLVLNSLTEDKLQASLRCLAYHGRFLEIGKYDMIMGNKLDMGKFLKNIEFHGILLDALYEDLTRFESDRKTLIDFLSDGINNGTIRPLRKTIFDSDRADDAFRLMASGKHIGKVIIKIRDEEVDRVAIPQSLSVKAIPLTLFSPAKSYIIIGGLGGFGLELIQWMVEKGAQKVVVSSRNGLRNNYQKYIINRVRAMDAQVVINNYDITCYAETEKLILLSESMGEVGGIFNVAMVLSDGLFEGQSFDSFMSVCKPKVNITINMDAISREKCLNLDYFVVFSSLSCGKGNAGQTNYGFANSVMERICESRRRDGLHGLAIQWGAIGDVGVVADRMGGNDIEIAGSLPQRIKSCLEVLDRFLQSGESVLTSYVKAVRKEHISSEQNTNLITRVYNILGIKDRSDLSPNTTLAELGMDSLTGSEVKQTLDKEGLEFSTQELRNVTISKIIELSKAK